MRRIVELPRNVRAKLAAGEVIERPAYIVKELIDNAIDAKAQNIRIELEKSGLQKIVVTDDGQGMSKEDLELCFKRYTTSKMYSEEDLGNIVTMGFRGEALSSISAVSELTIKSREKSSISGYEVKIIDGVLQTFSPKGMPVGTQVIVEQIFAQFPARKKFLKTDGTEYRHILDVIFRYTLAFPQIRFDVYHDGKKVQILVASTSEDRIEHLFSPEIVQYLLPFDYREEYFSVKGFISKPQLSYKSSRHIYHFVNNRYVHDSDLTAAIKETYGTLLEPVSFPHAILFIDTPVHLVDVNVHPKKEEVRFVNKGMIINGLQKALKKALSEADLHFYDKRWSGDPKEFEEWQIRDGGTNTYAAKKIKKSIQKNLLSTIPKNQTFFQFHNLYIAVPTQNGILLFDQHAVHERILYEKLQQTFEEEMKKNSHFKLKKAIMLPITFQEKTLLEEYKQYLLEIGFNMVLEEDAVQITSVPQLLQDYDIKVVIRELLDELFTKGERLTFQAMGHKMIAYVACRSAVKAGDYLTQEQCGNLIEELKKTNNPYTCPHGRPTQVEMNLSYFHKLFRRN